jgi:hypothetical protein
MLVLIHIAGTALLVTVMVEQRRTDASATNYLKVIAQSICRSGNGSR